MTTANGANPLRWDCAKRGCFNEKKRPKIEVFAECFPGRISFGKIIAPRVGAGADVAAQIDANVEGAYTTRLWSNT